MLTGTSGLIVPRPMRLNNKMSELTNKRDGRNVIYSAKAAMKAEAAVFNLRGINCLKKQRVNIQSRYIMVDDNG